MINHCYGCGKEIRTTTAADKKSARIICDECFMLKAKKLKLHIKFFIKTELKIK
jgi:hypothetical protein